MRDELLAPAYRSRRARSSSLASTICTSVDQPSEATPRNPERNAARALPSSVDGSSSANMKVPVTAHSPGSAARSNTNVSDGSSRMVRNSFMTLSGPARLGIEPARLGQRRDQRAPLDIGPCSIRRTSRSPLSSMSRRAAFSGASRARYVLAISLEAALLPGVDLHHEMAREASDQFRGASFVEAFVLDRRRQRPQPGLAFGHRHGADHAAEHQPVRRLRPPARPTRRTARRRPGPHRRRSHPARRRRSASRAAHAPSARRSAPPSRHRTRAARCAAARPAPAPRRIRRDRNGRRKPACRRRVRRRSPWHARRRRRPRAA